MTLRGLYAITDSQLLPGERLPQWVDAALAGGARLLQYRDKSTDAALRREQAQRLKTLCDYYGAALIINDDLALAAELGVGLHLGRDDGSLREARQQLGRDAIIGATCHASLEFAEQSTADGASYLAFGRFFQSVTKPGAPAATPVLLSFYALEPQTKSLTLLLVLIHNIFSALVFPFADPLGKGLRACGDVNFTMATSLFTTLGVRLCFSILFALVLHQGVLGIAYAMCLDWTIRGLIFIWRYKKGSWETCRVI